MVTHSLTMLEKQLVFRGETAPRNFATNRVKKRSMKSEDPMSHRIIEKRRRDRMNNCLADLSRLIPPEYLKKGRGRIEKTEIIEMAIKHIGHLQNVISSTRFNENSNGSVPSPPAGSAISRDPPSVPLFGQPITVKHYRMGYLECMSEAMHFLVEVQGFFAGDSLCVQMINHLRSHCDKLLKENALNFSRKHPGGITIGSDSSTSPVYGNWNGSPSPLGTSDSTAEDNQPGFESKRQSNGNYSPEGDSDSWCISKGMSEGPFYPPRYLVADGIDGENSKRDSDHHRNLIANGRNGFFGQRNHHPVSSLGEIGNRENNFAKEENGSSQLREMLTSPTFPSNGQGNGPFNGNAAEEVKGGGDASPSSNGSEHTEDSSGPKKRFKLEESKTEDRRQMMYKFKNKIKQRFTKEKGEMAEGCGDVRIAGDKGRGDQSDRTQAEEEAEPPAAATAEEEEEEEKKNHFKFNSDPEIRNEKEEDISKRLNFRHGMTEKPKRWEEPTSGFHFWMMDQNPLALSLPNSSPPLCGFGTAVKSRLILSEPEFSSATTLNDSYHDPFFPSSPPDSFRLEIPIFALHANGSFYVPLTVDRSTLAPFLAILGIAKGNEVPDGKTVLHPVTISVNFQSRSAR